MGLTSQSICSTFARPRVLDVLPHPRTELQSSTEPRSLTSNRINLMDNIILSGMLREFVKRHALINDSPEQQFEKFANYCLMRADHYDSFDFEKVGTGECIGIDGVAVSIGGIIVDDLEDAMNFTRMQFEARFIFAQAKTSSKFDLGDFLKFTSTVRVFFGSEKTAVPPELHKAFDIKQHIYERAAKLRELPVAELAYVYAGKFDQKNAAVQEAIEQDIRSLREVPYLFSNVTCNVHDGDAMARLYRETQNEILVDVPFQRHVALPAIRGAKSAYLGVLKCSDYVRMISKENGELNKGLFFENVRDFLGAQNPVNEDIAKTIHRQDERDRFAILNNGVTIVARGVTPSGDTFRLSQFQVVNGCQTSHVLFNHRDDVSEDMYLTVKLIETSDVDLSGQVIATTNSQSQVTKEAFATIRPYHRIIEDFFNAMRSHGFAYYYERRPHQYDDRHDILQQHVVSAPSLIKSFVSTVLEEPHQVHYYYGTLLSEYNKSSSSELFSGDDYPGLYFAAHHLAFRTRSAAARNSALKEWGYHLALMVKRAVAPELRKGSTLNDKKFLDVLARIDDQFDAAFRIASNVVQSAGLTANANRVGDVTRRLMDTFSREAALGEFMTGAKPLNTSSSFRLSDGRYVGTLERIDHSKLKAVVQYGPFRIVGDTAQEQLRRLSVGDRVTFTAENGRIFVSDPKLERSVND
jgi:hypothetical protein